MPKISVKNENKSDKFKRIASARTLRILNDLRLLGNCANISTYSYSEADINKIFSTIEKDLRRVKALFADKEVKFELK